VKNINIFLFLIAIAISSTVAAADEIVIIVNSANKQKISLEDVKNIYSDNINNWKNGARIHLLNLPMKSKSREVFSQKVLGMSAYQASTAEANRKTTNALRNPSQVMRERLIGSIVSKKVDAIGYVSKKFAKSKLKSNVKILIVVN